MNTSFGQTLRNAREAKGLTTSQVAAQTRMLVQIVEEMEREDFHRIAAPIYGRGFVKLYAECVGLDPLPLVREFMDIYEGRRAPVVQTREVPLAPEPPPVKTVFPAAPAPETPVTAPAAEPDTFPAPESVREEVPFSAPDVSAPELSEPEPNDEPAPAVPETEPAVRGLDLFEQAAAPQRIPAQTVADIFADSPYLGPSSPASTYAQEKGPSAADRFRTGLSSVSHGVLQTVQNIPRRTWRISILFLSAALVIVALILGCYKLFQITALDAPRSPAAVETTAAPNATKANTAETTPASQPVPPAQPLKLRATGANVPTLYAD